ncbi:MAG: bifunctional 5,10-methylenetetrahydrofolate dehydrogenase/5,10-methenyltetrahydrofolate cyclohydrolase [Elusimicrobiota bacterium]
MNLLKGKPLSDRIRKDLRARAAAVAERRGSPPHLAILAIGGDPSSQIYLKKKLQACKEVGIECTVESLHDAISQAEVLRILHGLGQDATLDGIIIDLPIPESLDAGRLTDAIAADKDVEGVSTWNLGKLYSEKSYESLKASDALVPCTPNAIIHLLLETALDPRGKQAVVIGRSNIVGRPTAHLLSCLDATLTLCHSRTRDLEEHVRRADILVCAAGKPRFVRGEWIKSGAVVLDAGIHREGDTLCGDVDFDAAAERAAFITPVPGGIGPLTVTFLLFNTVVSAERRTKRQFG